LSKTTITCENRFSRAVAWLIRTVVNNFTFDGSPRDAMQQAVRDALTRNAVAEHGLR